MLRSPLVPAARRLALATAALAALAAAPAAGVTITFDVVGGAPAEDVVGLGNLSDPGQGYEFWTLSDAPLDLQGVKINAWTVQLGDYWLTNNINVTNETSALQTIVASVAMPLDSPTDLGAAIASSFGIAFTDSDGNGDFLLQTDGATPFYSGFADGGTVLSLDLVDAPFTTADCAPFAFKGCSGSAANGISSAPASGTTGSLGIELAFQLSPGDSVAFTSRFAISPSAIAPIPEPGTALLLGLGLLGLGGARRRARRD